MGRMTAELRGWRRRQSSRRSRWLWTVAILLGYVAWTWLVHRWAVTSGRSHLLEGARPLYIGVAAFSYLPAAGLLWLLAFPGERRLWPWAEEEQPPRFMTKGDAEALAHSIRGDTLLPVRVVQQGRHFAVDIDAPATRYRLLREDEWSALRSRFLRRHR